MFLPKAKAGGATRSQLSGQMRHSRVAITNYPQRFAVSTVRLISTRCRVNSSRRTMRQTKSRMRRPEPTDRLIVAALASLRRVRSVIRAERSSLHVDRSALHVVRSCLTGCRSRHSTVAITFSDCSSVSTRGRLRSHDGAGALSAPTLRLMWKSPRPMWKSHGFYLRYDPAPPRA